MKDLRFSRQEASVKTAVLYVAAPCSLQKSANVSVRAIYWYSQRNFFDALFYPFGFSKSVVICGKPGQLL
jgi:hypothetical protein